MAAVHDVDSLGHDPMEPAPPEGVFQALGVTANEGNDTGDGDDELIRQRARDLLVGGGKGMKGGNAIVVEDKEFGKASTGPRTTPSRQNSARAASS